MKTRHKIITLCSMAFLLTACHDEVKRENPMLQASCVEALKKQLFLGGPDARTCATAMSNPKAHEVNVSVCTPWVDKQYQKYKTNIENRNKYVHENNAVPIREDFNDEKVWQKLLNLWQVEHEKMLAEEKEKNAQQAADFKAWKEKKRQQEAAAVKSRFQ